MGIIIRKALSEDACSLADCDISCWQSAYKGIVPDEFLEKMLIEKDQRVEKYRKALSDPGDCEYYCAMYAETMIGFFIIHKSDGDIWAIYLIEKFWGKGYGKDMMKFAVNELKRIGHKKILIWVFEDNHRARRFYEKYGFSFDGTKKENDRYGKPLVQFRYVLNVR